VVGDVHAHPSDPKSYDNIVLAMNDLRDVNPNVPVLVINGDLTQQGWPNQYAYLTTRTSSPCAHSERPPLSARLPRARTAAWTCS